MAPTPGVMSPPCQPFCRMGNHQGLEDRRSRAFRHLMDLFRQAPPEHLVLENVPRVSGLGRPCPAVGADPRPRDAPAGSPGLPQPLRPAQPAEPSVHRGLAETAGSPPPAGSPAPPPVGFSGRGGGPGIVPAARDPRPPPLRHGLRHTRRLPQHLLHRRLRPALRGQRLLPENRAGRAPLLALGGGAPARASGGLPLSGKLPLETRYRLLGNGLSIPVAAWVLDHL